MSDNATIWVIIVALGLGTYAVRFSFLGLIGDRALPKIVERHLRYIGISMFPAIVAPLVAWPAATGGEFDMLRFLAALAAAIVGFWRKSVIAAVLAGFATLFTLQYLLG